MDTNSTMPPDVQWAMCIRWGRCFVGSETMEKLEDIYKKYPQWFPWETKYRSIPPEVHEDYLNKKNPLMRELKIEPVIGLWERMQEQKQEQKKPKKLTVKRLEKVIKDLYYSQEKARKRKEKAEKKAKKLWDKHYKKYKLEYRG